MPISRGVGGGWGGLFQGGQLTEAGVAAFVVNG